MVTWLTPLNTDPATARYPATVVTIAGNATGKVMMAALIAAKANPMFLSF
jgi:hypothetical protein